jgi:CBS domain-containing protein
MTRRDDHLDALVGHLGSAYYQALRGDGSAAEVTRAVARVAEAEGDDGVGEPSAAPQPPSGTRRTGRWQVSDVMTTKVVSVAKDASYRQIAERLSAQHLTALPVVAADGRVVGVVSEADLLRKQERHEHSERKPGWQFRPAARTKAEARTAVGLMTSPAVTIGPEALLGTAARVMSEHRVKRLPVVAADGTLIGIVSRTDLLRVFLRPDAEIAAEAMDVLTRILLADPRSVHVSASNGVLTLTGRLETGFEIATAVRLIEAIDGVVAVNSTLYTAPSHT